MTAEKEKDTKFIPVKKTDANFWQSSPYSEDKKFQLWLFLTTF